MNNRFCSVLGWLAIGLSLPTLTAGQEGLRPTDGAPISAVVFVGLDQVSESFCRTQIVTTAGQPYVPATLREDRRRLIRTGKFLDVTAIADPVDDQVLITFTVNERPTVALLAFVGNTRYDDKALGKEIDLEVGDALNRFRVELGARAIERLYESDGYGEARVEADGPSLEQHQVVYHIEEGPRIRLRDVAFEGNTAFDDDVLKQRLRTATWIPLFRTGDFSADRAEQDATEVQNYYRDRGFLDARVSYRTAPRDVGGDLEITFFIDEGDRYVVSDVQFEGNTISDAATLQGAMELAPGQVLVQQTLVQDIKALKDHYGRQGYLYTLVEATRAFTEQPGEVQLRFAITEGRPYRVGRIVIRGNERTQDRVVRRMLTFFPDETFDSTRMEAGEAAIRNTGLFSQARITPVGEHPDVRDVLVDVTEAERTINFLVGGGIGSNSGLGGSITFESRNFDLNDWPVSWSEFIRARSFRGAGQYFRIELSPGTEVSSFRIVFREPYLFDRPLSLGTNFFLFERGRADWDERRLGAIISLGKTLEDGIFSGWAGELAFRLESIGISDISDFPARDIADAEGNSVLTSFKARLARNRTDSGLLPTTGDILSFSAEQALGDYFFTRLETAYTWYRTVRTDDQDRKSVVALKGELGYILGDAPVFESYYAGGIGSLRGFSFRGVTPRDGPFFDDDQEIGGRLKVLAGAEYSFPMFTKTLRGVVFTDMGTVEEGLEITSWRASVGVGLRLLLEQIAPIPFEFNFAFPIAKDADDDTQIFSFALGLTF